MGKGPKQKREVFIAALLAHPTVIQAAKACGISESTATRWLQEPQFKQRYAEARQQVLREALHYLEGTMLAAVATLRQVMLDANTKPSNKIQAARTILELGLRSHELYEIEERIAALEATLGGKR